jgi:chromate reductase
MTTFMVGYFVGSLATESINRKLAKALLRLAPPEFQMTEIPIKNLPLYNYDYDYPSEGRALKDPIATAPFPVH